MRDRVRFWLAVACVTVVVTGCGQAGSNEPALKELQRVKSGDLDVVMMSDADGLMHGKDSFVLEFRSGDSVRDVGTVKANATMPMAGMPPMFGTLELQPSGTPGRYLVNSDFGMAGTWQINVEWEGQSGRGSTTLRGAVR